MKDLPVIGLSFGPIFMVLGSLNPEGWQIIAAFVGAVMLSFSLVAMYRRTTTVGST